VPSSSRQRLAIRIGIALLVVALGVALVALARDTNSDPSDDSPEAGFSRAMADHHAQAVTMGDIIRDRTQDPVLKTTATDIVLTQQSQIGRMQGWLDVWGLPLTSTDPPMAWMGHEGPMPGMATRAEINSLSTLPVADAEIEFLRLMIAHHEGGIAMAEAILERTDRDEVVNLATAIAESQRAEIIQMEQLLSDRGATT
jgi:uncharacterized protein (DUF305 family)